MIFVDTNVFMYAVGRSHPLKGDARAFFEQAFEQERTLVTSTEVLQEFMHVYVPVQRIATLDAAMALVDSFIQTVWTIEGEDVRFARRLLDRHPELSARDLLHLACCRRRGARELKTFDRALGEIFRRT